MSVWSADSMFDPCAVASCLTPILLRATAVCVVPCVLRVMRGTWYLGRKLTNGGQTLGAVSIARLLSLLRYRYPRSPAGCVQCCCAALPLLCACYPANPHQASHTTAFLLATAALPAAVVGFLAPFPHAAYAKRSRRSSDLSMVMGRLSQRQYL